MKINVGICDDEKILCDELKRLVMDIKPNWNVSIYNNGTDLLKNIDREYVLLLDIEMPDISGMKIAKFMRQKHSDIEIIFLTSHSELMPEAFKVRAFRFLNKPIDIDKLKEALDEAEKEIINNKKITINSPQGIKIINIKDIVFFEAYGDGTFIYTKNEVIDSRESLRWWEEKLGDKDFYRTHRTYMVALRYISGVENTKVRLTCRNDEVPVARRQIMKLKEAVFEYTKMNARMI